MTDTSETEEEEEREKEKSETLGVNDGLRENTKEEWHLLNCCTNSKVFTVKTLNSQCNTFLCTPLSCGLGLSLK